jgi:hypothetical protein
MKVRQHVWVADRCLMCGAISWERLRSLGAASGNDSFDGEDRRQCIEREDYAGALMPEPARRQLMCEAFDDIGARMTEIEKERIEAINTPDPD